MDTVVVRGLALNLARNADGVNNWDDLIAASSSDSATGSPSTTALAAFALGGVALENARIRFDDAAADRAVELAALNARTGPISLGEPIDADLDFDYAYRGEGRTVTGHSNGQTSVDVDPGTRRVTLNNIALDVDANAPALAQGTIKGRVEGSLTFETAQQRLSGQALTVVFDALRRTLQGLGH